MVSQFINREFIVFLGIGGLAAAVNFFSRLVYSRWLDFSEAVIVAYVTGMVVAYILMRLLVFTKSDQPISKSIVFFVLVNGFGILQTFAVSMILYYLLPLLGVTRWVPEIAHGVGIAVPAFSSYIGHKRFSFK
jgi:putative flippase GtrA